MKHYIIQAGVIPHRYYKGTFEHAGKSVISWTDDSSQAETYETQEQAEAMRDAISYPDLWLGAPPAMEVIDQLAISMSERRIRIDVNSLMESINTNTPMMVVTVDTGQHVVRITQEGYRLVGPSTTKGSPQITFSVSVSVSEMYVALERQRSLLSNYLGDIPTAIDTPGKLWTHTLRPGNYRWIYKTDIITPPTLSGMSNRDSRPSIHVPTGVAGKVNIGPAGSADSFVVEQTSPANTPVPAEDRLTPRNLLNEIEFDRYTKWKASHGTLPKLSVGGGHFSLRICYGPVLTSIKAVNWKGEEYDLTDYDSIDL